MLGDSLRRWERPHSAGPSGRGKRNSTGTAVTAALTLLLILSFFTNVQVCYVWQCLLTTQASLMCCTFYACSAMQVWLDLGGNRASRPTSSMRSATTHPVPQLRSLVLVACHAVFIGSDYRKAEDPDAWLLLDYQKVCLA